MMPRALSDDAIAAKKRKVDQVAGKVKDAAGEGR